MKQKKRFVPFTTIREKYDIVWDSNSEKPFCLITRKTNKEIGCYKSAFDFPKKYVKKVRTRKEMKRLERKKRI